MTTNIAIHDANTGETIERPMNADEQQRHDALLEQTAIAAQAIADRAAAVASARVKLAKLGLTDNEIAAFLA